MPHEVEDLVEQQFAFVLDDFDALHVGWCWHAALLSLSRSVARTRPES